MKSGNVNHVAAFEKLVGICNDLGARYNPSMAAHTPTALATLLEQAQQSLKAVTVTRTNYVLAINSRQDMNAGIYPLIARAVRALSSSRTSNSNLQDARMIRRKLAPMGMSKKVIMTVSTAEGSAPTVSRPLSFQDYDSRANVFESMIELLQGIPAYMPNEPELTLAVLKKTLADFRSASQAVAATANALANARIARNKIMIGPGGIYATGTEVKEYIRSAFGIRSEAAKQVGKLRLAA